MSEIAILTCLICGVFAYFLERKLFCPAIIFDALWGLITVFTRIRLFGLIEVSSDVYTVIFIGTLFFNLGCLLSKVQGKKKFKIRRSRNTVDYIEYINYKAIYVVSAIIMVYMVFQSVAVFFLLRSGYSMFDIRSALQGYAESDFVGSILLLRRGNGWLVRIYDWFVLPAFHSLLIIECIDMIAGKKDKVFLIMTLVNTLLKVYSEGTRVVLFDAAIYIVVLLLVFNRKINLSRRTKKRMKIVFAAAVILLIVVSNIRLETMQKTIAEEIYLYFCCCMPLLDRYMTALIHDPHTFGIATLYGLIQTPVLLLENLGIPVTWYRNVSEVLNKTETFYLIRMASYSTSGNAYVTMYYAFLSDFGMIGCALCPLLFGYFSSRTYSATLFSLNKGKLSYRALFLFLVFVLFIVNSFIRIQFCRVDFANMVYMCFLFFRKKPEDEISDAST